MSPEILLLLFVAIGFVSLFLSVGYARIDGDHTEAAGKDSQRGLTR